MKNESEWQQWKVKAKTVLTHHCTDRCKMRIGEGDGPENYKCRKPNVVKESKTPLQHEFKPLRYEFDPLTKKILMESGLLEPPSDLHPNGKISSRYLNPTRHFGRVHPGRMRTCTRMNLFQSTILLKPTVLCTRSYMQHESR